MGKIIAGKTVYVNKEGQPVEEDSEDAAFLVARKGAAVHQHELDKYGLKMEDVEGEEEDTRTEEEKAAESETENADVDAGDEKNGDYESMKKDELVALAEERGVEVKSSMTKAEIIEALEAAE